MIIFGTCVGNEEKYQTVALPSIRRVAAAEDLTLARSGQSGICRAYNQCLEEARLRPDCDALVLMHEDVEILDDDFRAKALLALQDPGAGVAGVIGGAGLRDQAWWHARTVAGFVRETRGAIGFGARRAEVDVVDGLVLILSPAAFGTLSFDEITFPGFHGYGADYCLQARNAGLRVVVTDIDLFHHAKISGRDMAEWHASGAAMAKKWPQYLRKPPLLARAWARFARLTARSVRRMAP